MQVSLHLSGFSDYSECIDAEYLWPFFALPSMRYMMGEGVRLGEMILLPERSSNVIRVDLKKPYELTPENTRNLLGIFKALRIFRFLPETDWSISGPDPLADWVFLAIRNSLILYAKHSLEQLSLYIDDEDDDWDRVCIGDLLAFEVLKKIEINTDLLLGKRGPFRKTLAEVLPVSVKDLTIQDSQQQYHSLVSDLLSVKHHSVPNLKRLRVRESFLCPAVKTRKDVDLKMACKDAGFIFETIRGK